MLRTLHRLSALYFYLLGASFFLAYVLMRNGIQEFFSAWWLQVADLPLLLCGCLYGGTSLYLSVAAPESKTLKYLIAVPIGLFFLWMLFWNFSNLWW